jgi:hypothetical protein
MISRRWTVPGAVIALALCVAPQVASFSIDAAVFTGFGPFLDFGDAVHEAITRKALHNVMEDLPHRFIEHIVRGNQNADGPTHKFDNVYHVNSANTGNGAFRDSFRLIRHLIDDAVADARDNGRFLAPRHDTLQGTVDDIADTLFSLGLNLGCNVVGESACPQAQLLAKAAEVRVHSVRLLLNPMADPHGAEKDTLSNLRTDLRTLLDPPHDQRYCRPLSSHCFDHLDRLLTGNDDFQTDVRHLRRLEAELRAYSAWQNLGHALHTAQDFFAHSNFVELVNGRKGPPCGTRHDPALCDRALDGDPRRTDPQLKPFLDLLRPGFPLNLETLQTVLGPSFPKLQTGLVQFSPGLTVAGIFCVDTLPAGFHYCHWPHKQTPGLNKDDAEHQEQEPAKANHAYARQVAVFASEVLLEDFLRRAEFLPPAATAERDLGPRLQALKALLARQRIVKAIIPLLADDDD